GSIGGLVVAFILTLVDEVPVAQIVNRGLLDAWKMAVMPMVLMIAFNLVLGISPQRLLRQSLSRRLDAAAEALEGQQTERLQEKLGEGNAEAGQGVMLGRLFHTAPASQMTWLS